MPIHGIVSTYFGDLEYDIGKCLTWTRSFCDDVYAMDISISNSSRQYVLDWDRAYPNVKQSFYSKPFLASPTTAAAWRKESFNRAKSAWNYDPNDWVMFIDGTEGLNVFHKPSTLFFLSEVEIDGVANTATITTSTTHSIEIGNTVTLAGAQTVSVPYQVEGSYTHTQEALDADSSWTVIHNLDGEPDIATFTVYDTDDESVGVNIEIEIIDSNSLIVSFDSIDPTTGNSYDPPVPIDVYGTISFTTSDVEEQLLELDGSYLVTAVPDNTSFVIESDSIVETLYPIPFRNRYLRDELDQLLLDEDDEPIESENPPEVVVSSEPPGYFEGDVFQSWINYEIDNAEGADFISLDGWALIRSGVPTPLTIKSDYYDLQRGPATATTCEEYYVPMGSLIRLARVGALNDIIDNEEDEFWLKLDQPQEASVDVYEAENMSLISYAYVRWADKPTYMTQSVDPEAPHHVAGDELDPPLRPVDISYDAGYAMRRLISQVRALDGLPTEPADWGDADPDGEQPLQDSYKKLDLLYTPVRLYIDGHFVTAGFKPYGGSPLYPGILRSNLREGIWYVSQTSTPVVNSALSSGGISAEGIAQVNTPTAHNLSVGQSIVIYGTPVSFDGNYVITEVPSTRSFRYQRDVDMPVSTVNFQPAYPLAQVSTVARSIGPIPWNYLLNSVGVEDPEAWINFSSNSKKGV